jgi:hypothetical protein
MDSNFAYRNIGCALYYTADIALIPIFQKNISQLVGSNVFSRTLVI